MKSISTALAAGTLAAAVFSAGIAAAEGPETATHPIGAQGTVAEGPGVHGWTVNDLRPSADTIPYQPQGTLWEASATDEAIQGAIFPMVANFSARSASGQNYQALFTVPTAQGIAPAALTQGQRTSGKVYFDVTGDAPNSLVYQAGGADLIRWVVPAPQPQAAPQPRPQAPAPQQTPSGGAQAPTGGGSHRAPAPARPPASNPAKPAPSGGSSGTPLPEGSSGTPLPAGTP